MNDEHESWTSLLSHQLYDTTSRVIPGLVLLGAYFPQGFGKDAGVFRIAMLLLVAWVIGITLDVFLFALMDRFWRKDDDKRWWMRLRDEKDDPFVRRVLVKATAERLFFRVLATVFIMLAVLPPAPAALQTLQIDGFLKLLGSAWLLKPIGMSDEWLWRLSCGLCSGVLWICWRSHNRSIEKGVIPEKGYKPVSVKRQALKPSDSSDSSHD